MREVRVKSNSEIQLGRRGENLATRVIFNVGDWLSEPGGSVQLIHQRNGDELPYPCAITADGDTVIWDILTADVAIPGRGRAELQYLRGDVCIKSSIFITNTADSLDKAGEVPPDPHKSWVQQVLEIEHRVVELNEHPPIPGDNGFWWIWNPDTDQYEGSSFPLPEGGSGGSGGTPYAVQYVPQTLSKAQQTQARSNIDALGKEELPAAVNDALALAKASGEFDGPAGTPGKDGSDASVTAANIKTALGYTPADEKVVSQLSEDKVNKPTSGNGTAGQFLTSDGNGGTVWVSLPMYAGEVEDA